ncbi:MAG: site-2 protease family protein, partial [Christensenellaceae bacterium]|nr:site-2 protease family protein [Christensenellaceae bacterium]
MSLLYIFLAILLLGILITVHELGHFTAARIVGIPVKEFSIGFGPKLISWKSKKHDTLFKISAIPMGGYCMFYGETGSDPEAGEEVYSKDDPRLYNNHNVWKRMFTVISGPIMNFILAVIVAIALVGFFGNSIEGLKVIEVQSDSPAYIAGLIANDEVLTIEGQSVNDGTINGISNIIDNVAAPDKELSISVLRDGKEHDLKVTPKFDETEKRFMIGITVGPILGKIAPSQIFPQAWGFCVEASSLIAKSLGKLFTTGEGFDQTSGPIGVVKIISEQTQQGGLAMFLNLAVIISINLGLVNLLPIPGLDGARLIF